ncbi:hypothetical protein VTI28DRAFT_10491 [Corynascus sepedonium]
MDLNHFDWSKHAVDRPTCVGWNTKKRPPVARRICLVESQYLFLQVNQATLVPLRKDNNVKHATNCQLLLAVFFTVTT